MTIALLTLTGLSLLVAAVSLGALLKTQDRTSEERKDMLEMIDALTRRIQAPELATIPKMTSEPAHQPPALDDDEGYWEARREMTSG